MLKRFSVLPYTLYRMQSTQFPKLRNKQQQLKKHHTTFDFILGENKLYNPIEGDTFTVPNGLSIRPLGLPLADILSTFNAKFVYELPKGLEIPKNFVVILEYGDHHSFQTAEPINPKQFQKKAGQFFKQQKMLTKNELRKKILDQLEKTGKKQKID